MPPRQNESFGLGSGGIYCQEPFWSKLNEHRLTVSSFVKRQDELKV